jgi:predicted RNA-binding Zn ribbon-like protein
MKVRHFTPIGGLSCSDFVNSVLLGKTVGIEVVRDFRDLATWLAVSACDLLCDHDWSRLKRCANPACGFYFYDSTGNRTRRSCSIETCGNRMKVAAYRARQRAARSSPIG